MFFHHLAHRDCVKFFTLRISFHAIASWQTISLITPIGSIFFSFLAQMELKLFSPREIVKHFRILWVIDLIKNITFGVGALWGEDKNKVFKFLTIRIERKAPQKEQDSQTIILDVFLYRRYKNNPWSSLSPFHPCWLLWE